jgi:hypothetical protein
MGKIILVKTLGLELHHFFYFSSQISSLNKLTPDFLSVTQQMVLLLVLLDYVACPVDLLVADPW